MTSTTKLVIRIILTGILYVGGFALIWAQSSGLCALGVFLVVWAVRLESKLDA